MKQLEAESFGIDRDLMSTENDIALGFAIAKDSSFHGFARIMGWFNVSLPK